MSTFNLFDVTCEKHRRTALNPFLYGTKIGDIGGTCKRSLIRTRTAVYKYIGAFCVHNVITGIGTGMGPVILADIARVTSVEERTATLSAFSAIRQLGLLIGK